MRNFNRSEPFTFFNQIFRFSVKSNLIWSLFNLPVFLFIILQIFARDFTAAILSTILLLFSLPLLVFPATASLFALIRDFIVNEEEDQLMNRYLGYFKGNYFRNFADGLLFNVAMGLLASFYAFISSLSIVLNLLIILVGLLFLILTCNYLIFASYGYNIGEAIASAVQLIFSDYKIPLYQLIALVIFLLVAHYIPILLPIFAVSLFICALTLIMHYRLGQDSLFK